MSHPTPPEAPVPAHVPQPTVGRTEPPRPDADARGGPSSHALLLEALAELIDAGVALQFRLMVSQLSVDEVVKEFLRASPAKKQAVLRALLEDGVLGRSCSCCSQMAAESRDAAEADAAFLRERFTLVEVCYGGLADDPQWSTRFAFPKPDAVEDALEASDASAEGDDGTH